MKKLLNDSIYEIWNVVDDGGVLLPLTLVDKVNLFDLIKNITKYETDNLIIFDSSKGKILSKGIYL
jgi:hypothetical protein